MKRSARYFVAQKNIHVKHFGRSKKHETLKGYKFTSSRYSDKLIDNVFRKTTERDYQPRV